MTLRIVAAGLFSAWLILVLMGKGGFVHLLILNALGVLSVELMTVIRTRMRIRPDQTNRLGPAS